MELQKVKEFFKNVQEATNPKVIEVLENYQQTIGMINEQLMNQCNEITEIVYSNLFTLYHNGGDVQKAFVLHFLPALVWEYLYVSSNHGKKGHGKLEAVLLAIYNAEILDQDGEIKFQKFRLPSLSQPSVYHEPLLDKTSTSALTESALKRHEQGEVNYRLIGPGYKLSRIPACHRFAVVAFVLEQYNSYIAFMGEASLDAACKMAARAASCGFKNLCDKLEDDNVFETLSKSSRIPLDNAAIVQLVYIVYYAMYNGFSRPAIRAFQALHFRAAHSLFSPAYQLTLSIEHLLESGKEELLHGPLGLAVHTTSSESVSKLADGSCDQLPRCLDTSHTPWKRRCPYEILLAEKPVAEKLEVDSAKSSVEGKLKTPKDSRPKKAKSWASTPSTGKAFPVGTLKSPETGALAVTRRTVAIELTETRYSNIELLTGV